MRLRRSKTEPAPAPVFTGSCPIREHAGDGGYVGRCEFATYNGVCPRHGRMSMYPTRDDRDVDPRSRVFDPERSS